MALLWFRKCYNEMLRKTTFPSLTFSNLIIILFAVQFAFPTQTTLACAQTHAYTHRGSCTYKPLGHVEKITPGGDEQKINLDIN